MKNVLTTKNPIRKNNYCREIFTDASLSGWGAVSQGERVNGWWNAEECLEHINILELKAAFYGLKCFASEYRNYEVLLRIDNTTAIAYLNKMGGIQNDELLNLSREIWKWCEDRYLWIFATYINTNENTIADRESRLKFRETEWELSAWAFQEILNTFGPFEIDLFATKANAKCAKYISWMKDPDSLTVDAFTVSWAGCNFYAFPPFAIILRVLRKIYIDKAEGVIVVPWWPTQPWFPLFKEMLISEPIKFAPADNLLLSPSREVHPLSQKLSLVAAKLSGKRS